MCPLMQVAGCLRMAHSCLDIPPARLLKLLGRYAGNALNPREHLLPCLHPPSIGIQHLGHVRRARAGYLPSVARVREHAAQNARYHRGALSQTYVLAI